MLLGTLISTIALRNLLPTDALAPVIATLLFVVGAATAGLALLLLRDPGPHRVAQLRGASDFRRHRRLHPDRPRPDRQASPLLESTWLTGSISSAVRLRRYRARRKPQALWQSSELRCRIGRMMEGPPASLRCFPHEAMTVVLQVVMIDLVLAGDNAIVHRTGSRRFIQGPAQQGDTNRHSPPPLRIGFASITVQLLAPDANSNVKFRRRETTFTAAEVPPSVE